MMTAPTWRRTRSYSALRRGGACARAYRRVVEPFGSSGMIINCPIVSRLG
jgi:hypothetical protein